jgi:hypothetical protein
MSNKRWHFDGGILGAGPYGRVRKKWKWAELNAQKECYLKNGVFIDEDIKKMTEMFPKRGFVFTQYWFYTLDCCRLATDTFLNPIHFHTSSGAMLHPPLTSLSYFKNNAIALHLQPSHIILININKDLMSHIRQSTPSLKISVSGTYYSNRSLFKPYCSVHRPIRHPSAWF